MDNYIDFLAIGDIVTDAFIALDTDFAKSDGKTLSMDMGAKLPYKDVKVVKAVGNAPNASVSAARLGLRSAVMTHVGNDESGTECVKILSENGVSTDYMTTQEGKDTNYHYVLRLGAERTILIKHSLFDYNLSKQLEGKPIPSWVYFSSVAENSLPYHEDIAKWVKENNIKMAFQPGTFQIQLGYERLKSIYEATEIFFCNVQEAQSILKDIDTSLEFAEPKALLEAMFDLGPRIVCITDGPDGAYAYDGETFWYMPIYPDPQPPVERTGAGDSFSSTFTAAIAAGKTIPEALQWGPINSMSVVQKIGAQEGLVTQEELMKHLENAPENYFAKKI